MVKFTARDIQPRAGSGVHARFIAWITLLNRGPGVQGMIVGKGFREMIRRGIQAVKVKER